MVLIVLCFGVDFFVLFELYVRFHILVVRLLLTEWQPIGEKLRPRLTIGFLGIST